MALSALWTNYIASYPSGEQLGMTALANDFYDPTNPSTDLPGFVKQSIPAVSDTIIRAAPDYQTLSATRIRNNIQNISANCQPKEEIDNIFFNSVGADMANGVRSLINTMSNAGDNVSKVEDLYTNIDITALTTAIASTPCTHYFNQARSSAELTAARNYLNSVTSQYQGRMKLQTSDGKGLNGLYITALSNGADLTSVIASFTTDNEGNASFPFSYINDGSTPPTHKTVPVMVYDSNGNPLFEASQNINLPPE